MGIFAMGTRRPTDGPEARAELPEVQRQGVPPHFEAVGEALASGSGSTDACEVLGGNLAREGASLEEVLGGLAATCLVVRGREPDHAETRAIAVAWADATLAYLHQLSCEDPLTGLASLAHVRGRLADLYRGEVRRRVRVSESHALVVVAAPVSRDPGERLDADDLTRALRLSHLGATARTVFPGGETIGRLGPSGLAVVARREGLGPRVALLRRLLPDTDQPLRVWIEGLPGTDDAAARLLDELARS
ncbi:hypothetical protein GCM10009844_40200 [Nocardioides koreensis]|uniref:PucR family transcriptional regulator n=1 Tax=Nocardioides koreensis TaxID=433651 RepID=A0ABN3A5I9_9ACTN